MLSVNYPTLPRRQCPVKSGFLMIEDVDDDDTLGDICGSEAGLPPEYTHNMPITRGEQTRRVGIHVYGSA